MGEAKSKGLNRRAVLVLVVVFPLISLYPLYVAWTACRLIGADQPSTCELLDKGVDAPTDQDGSTQGYWPTVEIAHTVDGQRYERKDTGRRFVSESDARASTSGLRVGETIPCRYVAGSPAEVVALEQDPGQVRGMLVFAGILLVIPIGVFVYARTQPAWRER